MFRWRRSPTCVTGGARGAPVTALAPLPATSMEHRCRYHSSKWSIGVVGRAAGRIIIFAGKVVGEPHQVRGRAALAELFGAQPARCVSVT